MEEKTNIVFVHEKDDKQLTKNCQFVVKYLKKQFLTHFLNTEAATGGVLNRKYIFCGNLVRKIKIAYFLP